LKHGLECGRINWLFLRMKSLADKETAAENAGFNAAVSPHLSG
jgi:hypothetical protein